MKLEATQALFYFANGTTAQTKPVLDKGAIFWFIKLLYSKNQELIEQV